MKFYLRQFAFVILSSLLISCSTSTTSLLNPSKPYTQVYQVIGENQLIVRAITAEQECPTITWNDGKKEQLKRRVDRQTVALRKPSDGKASDFPITTCEISWPTGVTKASILQQTLYPLKHEIEKIVILGDTGCRLKDADNAYQDCNDPKRWPFKKMIESAAKFQPDLVVHVGDIHYRESPCPASQEGCKNSPWGYGFDTWKADFFDPAKTLLDIAPWAYVRGNHESCQRAGQGWHRFIAPQAWSVESSCNEPRNDKLGNYSEPFAVSLGKNAQLIIFDSANIPSKDLHPTDDAYKTYLNQINKSDEIASKKAFNIFANHHPISNVTPSKVKTENKELVLNKNSLTGVMQSLHQDDLLSTSFNATLHGHIHTAQAIDYNMRRPVSLISGNSGSALEFTNQPSLTLTDSQKKALKIGNFQSYLDFGFATLVRDDQNGLRWVYTAYDVNGHHIFDCLLTKQDGKSTCSAYSR